MSSSNSTSPTGPAESPSSPAAATTPTTQPPTPSSSVPAPPPPSSTSTPVVLPPTSSPLPPPTPSTPTTPPATPPTSAPTTTPPVTTPSSTPTTTPTPSSSPSVQTEVTVDSSGFTTTVIRTVTAPPLPASSTSSAAPSGTSAAGNTAFNSSDSSSGLGNGGKIAIAVVVPIAAIALLVLAGLYLWRKRKQRKDLEEQRRKEVEDYGYNPNADPAAPAVAGAGQYEMAEDGSGYRGWGTTTLAGSTAGKASTTMSGGAGVAYSDATSPTRGPVSDTRSGEPLMDGSPSPDGEILGAMGPAASNNRGGDVHRGPSNASSSYSGVARSDGSGDMPIGVAYGGSAQYYDQYGNGNPYVDGTPSARPPPAEVAGQPVIRDVTARRNTRIENPAHYPQQSAGISQNF
ncbi:hypothetical protein B0H63DRAFT_148009 [Podospora didyma]|uniref:Serine-rich protein n=1 Tax=Podospora didyma TaxID=330526 RepID=A0AAE0NSZ8_9PEZI|nr:hypothetical protein B0H63DRAFT_148009 [Podospora didyma]